ncbi:putative DNA-binding domain-containing protein [Roseateles sp.]|jgi:hypothetical protein|uniref:HvfC/BufC family peptide modification chaperone n=1 Tax=Roseateles sp. TaxID=1971397 RepID=UPI0037C62A4A
MSAAELQRQQALVLAILGAGAGGPASVPGLQPLSRDAGDASQGLQTYQTNAKALARRSLSAAYPRLLKALGEPQFAAMAWRCWQDRPPQLGEIGMWADQLPAFLAVQQDFPALWLDCARLEAAAGEAERAVDVALEASSLQLLGDTRSDALRIELRPGLALLSVCVGAARLWPLTELCAADEDQPVCALLWRKGWRAELLLLPRGDEAFTRALLQGKCLAQALQSALAAEAGFDFSKWLQQALLQGWLWRVVQTPEDSR